MKYYTQADYDQNKAQKKHAFQVMMLCALPFLAMAVAAFLLRRQGLCMAGCILCGCAAVLMGDLRVMPAVRYGRFLHEIRQGSSHKTLGTLVRVSEDLSYENGVDFHEVTLNVYEDLSEEGERRFLLDSSKKAPMELMGEDIVVTSYGHVILECEAYVPGKREEES